MTDAQYLLFDELYFFTPYGELKKNLGWPDQEIYSTLHFFWEKGWIRIYASETEEIPEGSEEWEKNYEHCYYLASKKGLFAHHTGSF